MIYIQKSPTADTRTCDGSRVTKEELKKSSLLHMEDVKAGLSFLADMLHIAAYRHDQDKLTELDWFHADFQTGFKETGWWDNHRKVNRHHLLQEDGVPDDVNLIDVLDMIVDCVMAGMARSGSVYPLSISLDVMARAFHNTVELMKANVTVKEEREDILI